MQRSRLQQNIDKARQSGAKMLDEEIIYKYRKIKMETEKAKK
jgi:hypothetical protein